MIQHPIRGFIASKYPTGNITQFFGENKELYNKAVCFGEDNCLQGHNGIDIVAPWGTPIYAVEKGRVVEAKVSETGFGKSVRILSGDSEWTYGHLSKVSVELKQEVNAGDYIGDMGNTGFVVSGSTPYWKYNPYKGTHLHLGKRKFYKYPGHGTWNIAYPSGDRGTIQHYTNGFFGAVDFVDEFDVTEEKHIITLQLTVISLLNQIRLLYRQLIGRYYT